MPSHDPWRCAGKKRCRGVPAVKYLGRWLCDPCWAALCRKKDREEERAIRACGGRERGCPGCIDCVLEAIKEG